jgi:hypothetical protein
VERREDHQRALEAPVAANKSSELSYSLDVEEVDDIPRPLLALWGWPKFCVVPEPLEAVS